MVCIKSHEVCVFADIIFIVRCTYLILIKELFRNLQSLHQRLFTCSVHSFALINFSELGSIYETRYLVNCFCWFHFQLQYCMKMLQSGASNWMIPLTPRWVPDFHRENNAFLICKILLLINIEKAIYREFPWCTYSRIDLQYLVWHTSIWT